MRTDRRPRLSGSPARAEVRAMHCKNSEPQGLEESKLTRKEREAASPSGSPGRACSIYTCVCMCIYIYIYTHVYIYIYIYAYI